MKPTLRRCRCDRRVRPCVAPCVFSAMGFYPVDPVSGNYVFGAPQMPKIVLHLADGKTFTVDRKSTRLNSSHPSRNRMQSSA